MAFDTADWQIFWAVVIGGACVIGWIALWIERRYLDSKVIPYKRVYECKPGAFSVGKDCK